MKPRRGVRTQNILVDLDNLYIIDNKVDIPTLKERLKKISKLKGNIYWYGNAFTSKLISKYGLDEKYSVNVIASNVTKNSADHNLIHHITTLDDKAITIISGDMTLCRLALFLNDNNNIKFKYFGVSNTLTPHTNIDFNFKNKTNLNKFLQSLMLYNTRYNGRRMT